MTNVTLTDLDSRFSETTGWYFREDQRVLTVEGEHRQTYLHSVSTQDFRTAKGPTLAALLNPKGKMLATFQAHVADDAVHLQIDEGQWDAVLEILGRYKMRSRVAWHERTDLKAFTVIGSVRSTGGLTTLDDPARLRTDALAAHAPEGFSMDAELFERHRVAFGIPRFGVDLSSYDLLLEIPYFMDAVSLNKGCYPGQEVVARLTSRGTHVARKLVRVAIDRPAPSTLPVGVSFKGADVGRLTSATTIGTRSLGLAMVHRSAFDPGTELALASGQTATILPSS